MLQPTGSDHTKLRNRLRVLGPIVVGVGGLFMLVGMVSFFSSFGSFESPRYSWCMFVGIPLIFFGRVMSQFGFLGATSRYMANEVAPVGKDLTNYMVAGTRDSVRDLASAVGEGLTGSRADREVQVVRCHKCNVTNDESANFCKSCGTSLIKSLACSQCGDLNDPDARYCDNCGRGIR